MKKFSAIWCFALAITACTSQVFAVDVPQDVLDIEARRSAAIEKAQKSAISVFEKGGQGGGSGVVITADGYALTNYHVSKPAGNHMQCSMPDGKMYDAVIVGIDPTGDVALIKLVGRDDFPAATIENSDTVKAGDWCFAVGNPFLLATDLQPTVTWGIVSGVHRYQYPAGTLLEYADCIQTDASINPGNSGGPLFNADGNLIGINGRGSFEKRGRVNVGVGYAISINQIQHFMGYLRSGRIVDHATLGANVITDTDGRVVVNDIIDSSDAYRRGLRYGDEIVAFAGRPIRTVNAFKNVLGIFPRDWRVPLSYRRDGVRHDILVRLRGVHSAEELLAKIQADEPEEESPPGVPPVEPAPKESPAPPPKPHDAKLVASDMPEPIRALFAAKTGYANYHFNKANLDRVWQAAQAHGDFTPRKGTWKFEGTVEGGEAIEISLSDAEASATFAGGQTKIDLKKDLDTQLGPTDSGGLVVALALWKRLLELGPSGYGDVYYLGTGPMQGREPYLENLVDIVVATHDVTETRFMFDPTSGDLVGLEMFPDRDVDPCEIYFSEYQKMPEGMMPTRLEVRHGDRVFGIIHLKTWKLPSPSKDRT